MAFWADPITGAGCACGALWWDRPGFLGVSTLAGMWFAGLCLWKPLQIDLKMEVNDTNRKTNIVSLVLWMMDVRKRVLIWN